MRDAKAFAQRVKMGKPTLWLLVEGREHDRPYYERALAACAVLGDSEYEIALVEELVLDGRSGGGKRFALALHDFFASQDALTQSSRSGNRYIAVAVDRDYDHVVGEQISSLHVMRTEAADVEAEILLRGDIERAVTSSYSLTKSLASQALTEIPPVRQLANLWRDWITLCYAQAAICEDVGARYGHPSAVNVSTYGQVDPDLVAGMRGNLCTSACGGGEEQFDHIDTAISEVYASGRAELLIKGRWLAGFIGHLVRSRLSDVPREKNVQDSVLIKTCLETIDFGRQPVEWLCHGVEALLGSGGPGRAQPGLFS